MSLIEVRAPGLLTTVQDLGREGFGPMGVSASGAADPVALRIGNRLVGNAEGAAGLEMTLLGGTFVFPERAVVALTGSDFGATLDNEPVEMWKSVEVRQGQTLRLGATRTGARCYLCVRGGIDVKLFLGSASTHLLSGLGGFQGRALREGDVLKIGTASGSFRTFRKRSVSARAVVQLAPRKVLRVTPGPQSDWFSQEVQEAFYAGTYRVTEESNRMGLRLQGAAIASTARRRNDFRRCLAWGGADYRGWSADYFVCGATDDRRISEDCECDFRGFEQFGAASAARRDSIRTGGNGSGAGAFRCEQEKLLASQELILE